MKKLKAFLLIVCSLASIFPVAAFIAFCTVLPVCGSHGKTIGEIIQSPMLIIGWVLMPFTFAISAISLYIPASLFAGGYVLWDIADDEELERERERQIQQSINNHKK